MSLEEKAAIGNLDACRVPDLQHAFETCIRSQVGPDDELFRDVLQRIWKVLQETHRARCVKWTGQTGIVYCAISMLIPLFCMSSKIPFNWALLQSSMR